MVLDGLLVRVKEGGETRYKVSSLGVEAFRKALVYLEELLAKLKL